MNIINPSPRKSWNSSSQSCYPRVCALQVLYKEHMAKGTPTPLTPEMERAKRNQENISSVGETQRMNISPLKSSLGRIWNHREFFKAFCSIECFSDDLGLLGGF